MGNAEPPAEEEWHVLVDEVWEDICSGDASGTSGHSLPSEAALAPLWGHLRRCTIDAAADPSGADREPRRTASAGLRQNTATNSADATGAGKLAKVDGAFSAIGKENSRSALSDRAVQPPPRFLHVSGAGYSEGEPRRDLCR